jgi:hypothetical protein
MRIPKSLSYSSLSLFEKDREEFFGRYLADRAAPRMPQEQPASVGSSFDAYVKAALHTALFGAGSNPEFEFDTIYVSQVEPQNRDFALGAGLHCFESYKLAGAYDDLLKLLQQSVVPPRFEFKVEGLIGGAPFVGKPDCRFILDFGDGRIDCIEDWKVKGFCSKWGASPSKGYALCRDGYKADKQSRSQNREHGNYLAYNHRGLTINAGYMEGCHTEYADQLCLYGWLLGETPGDENVVLMIEELVGKYMGEGNRPLLRVTNHRARVQMAYQMKLQERVTTCWKAITSGHIFPEMTREENDARCQALDRETIALIGDGSVRDNFFNDCVRPKYRG